MARQWTRQETSGFGAEPQQTTIDKAALCCTNMSFIPVHACHP
jgi:hypothetical protein